MTNVQFDEGTGERVHLYNIARRWADLVGESTSSYSLEYTKYIEPHDSWSISTSEISDNKYYQTDYVCFFCVRVWRVRNVWTAHLFFFLFEGAQRRAKG